LIVNDPQLKTIVALKTCATSTARVCGFSQQSHRFIKRDVNRIVDQLEGVWRQVVDQQPLSQTGMSEWSLSQVCPARADETDELNRKVDQLMAEMRSTKDADQKATSEATPVHSSKHSNLASTCS